MSNIKLENLEINDYMIYQDKDSFNFGIDAVLLANFALRECGGGARVTRPYDAGSQCSYRFVIFVRVHCLYRLLCMLREKCF